MNEQLQAKLVEILAAIQSGARAAGDFALEQLPDIAQQYVIYGRVIAVVTLALFVTASVAAGWVAIRWGYANSSAVVLRGYGEGDWLPHRGLAAIVGSMVSALCFVGFAVNIADALLVFLAPKVWLLQHIAALIK